MTEIEAKIKDLLQQHLPFKHIIQADQTTPLKEAFSILQTNNISSIPIYNPSKKEYIGIVDITDICLFIAFSYAQHAHIVKEAEGKEKEIDRFYNIEVGELLTVSEEGSLRWTYSPDDSIMVAVEAFSKGIHRALVKGDAKDPHYHILSQRDAVKYLYDSKKFDSIFSKKLKDIPELFAYQPALVTINNNTPAIEGFKKIGREHFGAIAVVDSEGNLSASLSGIHLRGIDDKFLRLLLLPTQIYLKTIFNNKVPAPLTATLDETLATAVEKILQFKDHRVWLIEGGKLSGVVTLSDVCRVFVNL